jgi:cytochrome P450
MVAPVTESAVSVPDVDTRDIGEIARDFHIFDPRLALDPRPMLDRLRNECPIAHSEMFGGYWVLTRYVHIKQVLADPETFSSTVPIIPRLQADDFLGSIPVTLDPPDHTGYRRILAPMFSPGRIAALTDDVRVLAGDLADHLSGLIGPFDFRRLFAVPLPAATLLKTLGLPDADLDLLLRYKDAMLADQFSPDPQVRAEFLKERVPEITEYFRGHIDLRRDRDSAPDDFFTNIVHASFKGERPLTVEEIVDIVAQHVQAALDTTTGQLCLHMAYFAQHQDRWRELVEHPERIPGAVEELLRHNAIVTPGRLVMRDTEVGGVPMRRGDMVALVLPAAAFDEDAFPDAGAVDFERKPNRHLTFGGGPHMCVGANLARFQLRIAYEELTRALPAFRIAQGTTPVRTTGIVMGMQSLVLERI